MKLQALCKRGLTNEMADSLIKSLVKKLTDANDAYRNTDKLLMTDDEYDNGIEQLKRLSPNHPFLSQIGAKPHGKTVQLPYMMASLDKILDGESLERWKKRMGADSYVLSEKLDGISCLYYKGKMYLRGDGVKGVDVSFLIGRIHLSNKALPQCVVRGELILRKSDTPPGSIGRSLINGWVHRHEMTAELATVRFVAYELIESGGSGEASMSRMEQMNWLKEYFEIPWVRVVNSLGLKEEYLKTVLMQRRIESLYSTDGIVVACGTRGEVGVKETSANILLKNPKDVIAFKMALEEQRAETVVTGIEWNLSRQGILIPTILINPVVIGEASIQRLSGHNAAFIERAMLGAGARIIIRRSGDVIPTLDSVLQGVASSMPTVPWKWDENKTHAIYTQNGYSKEAASKALLHALQTLEVDGIGPGLVDKLVEGGVDTLKKLSDTKNLGTIVGPGRGPKLLENVQKSLAAAPLMRIMIASNMLPRGVGERKLALLFDVEKDPSKWTFEQLCNVNGWGSLGIQEVLKAVPGVLEWCKQFSVGASSASGTSSGTPATVPLKGSVVFTGGRDKVLEGLLVAAGWSISDTLTKKTSHLIVNDDYDATKPSGKAKKAMDYGVPISRVSEFRERMPSL